MISDIFWFHKLHTETLSSIWKFSFMAELYLLHTKLFFFALSTGTAGREAQNEVFVQHARLDKTGRPLEQGRCGMSNAIQLCQWMLRC